MDSTIKILREKLEEYSNDVNNCNIRIDAAKEAIIRNENCIKERKEQIKDIELALKKLEKK